MSQLDAEYMKEIINNINKKIKTIEMTRRIEDFNKEKWVQEITEPIFKLIPNMITIMSEPKFPFAQKKIILNIFHYFLQMNPDIHFQLIENEFFPQIISEFIIESGKTNELDLNAINVFSYIYDTVKYSKYVNEDFIKDLFDCLPKIDDETVLENIIGILIDMNSIFPGSLKENKFLNVYHNHENKNLLEEVLLRILNNETNKEKMYKILLCLRNIMDKEKKIVFYSRDLESFIDIAIQRLESTYNDELRCFYLDILKRIVNSNDYCKSLYKNKELADLMEDYKNNDSLSETVQKKAAEVLKYLNKTLIKKLRIEQGIDVKDKYYDYEHEEEEDEDNEEGEEYEEEEDGENNEEEEK